MRHLQNPRTHFNTAIALSNKQQQQKLREIKKFQHNSIERKSEYKTGA